MADNSWYYAQGDEEKGPVPTAELKAMKAAGKLKPDDLVWKEGMADWAPARSVPGLFGEPPMPRSGGGATIPTKAPDSGERFRPAESAETPPTPRRPLLSGVTLPTNLTLLAKVASFALLLFGMMLVVLSKGCDSLGTRYVARSQARASLAESELEQEFGASIASLQNELDDLEALEEPSPSQVLEVDKTKEQITKLTEERDKRRTRLQRGEWRRLQALASDAADNNAMWAYYREAGFVFGSLVLVAGLFGTAATGQGAERWISYIMLAIITFSLYVGGFAFFKP